MYKIVFPFLFLFFCSLLHAETLKGSRPNIILIITDDQGYGPVGAHGHPWIKTLIWIDFTQRVQGLRGF